MGIDGMLNKFNIKIEQGIKIIQGKTIVDNIFDKRVNNIIYNIENEENFKEVRKKIKEYYKGETVVDLYYILEDYTEEILVSEINNLNYKRGLTINLKRDLSQKKDIYDLIELVDFLRGENGCEWDKVQTHESIKKAIIEESYEVMDAINIKDYKALSEELGDVLLQIIFHCSIKKDDELFNFNDVIEKVCNKMEFRHPHLFTNRKDIEDWDKIKRKEKKFKNLSSELRGVARALPALTRAQKVERRIEKVKGHSKDKEEIIHDIEQYLSLLKGEEYRLNADNIGRIIFNCVKLLVKCDLEAEEIVNCIIEEVIDNISKKGEVYY